jgi:hypothetical protein
MRPMNPADPARIERLERQVAYLLNHLEIDPEVAAGSVSASPFGSAADIFGAPAAVSQPFAEPQPFGAPQAFGGPQAFAEPQSSGEPAYPPDLLAAVERGDTIGAIKAYRAWTGVGLREAKDAVAAMTRGRR